MRRPRLALPFTVVEGQDQVHLVAGEDVRFALAGPGLERWAPALLATLDGRRTLEDLVAGLPAEQRAAARDLVLRLAGERAVVEAAAEDAHAPARFGLAVEGSGPLAEALAARVSAEPEAAARSALASPSATRSGSAGRAPDGAAVAVLGQDRLDWSAALDFGRRARAAGRPAIVATTGPLARGLVSPVVLPDAGPCLGCMVRRFRALSPAPEVHDALLAHARAGRPVEPSPFPDDGVAILAALVRWKVDLLASDPAPAAPFRLHVLEAATLEVRAHRVFLDPLCEACGG